MSAERSRRSKPEFPIEEPGEKRVVWESVRKRVLWWIDDMAYKSPETLSGRYGEHYYECMAQDIADWATGEEMGTLNAGHRLDP